MGYAHRIRQMKVEENLKLDSVTHFAVLLATWSSRCAQEVSTPPARTL